MTGIFTILPTAAYIGYFVYHTDFDFFSGNFETSIYLDLAIILTLALSGIFSAISFNYNKPGITLNEKGIYTQIDEKDFYPWLNIEKFRITKENNKDGKKTDHLVLQMSKRRGGQVGYKFEKIDLSHLDADQGELLYYIEEFKNYSLN